MAFFHSLTAACGVDLKTMAVNVILTLYVITVSTVIDIQAAAPPTCYLCNNIADPVDCETTIQCNTGESCFTDKFLSDDGIVKFNLGCKSQHICDIISQFGKRDLPEVLGEDVNKRSIIHLCTECCKAGYCNNAICTGLTTPNPSIQCYNCPDVEAPHACEHLKTCEADEECFADIWYNDRGDSRHSLGCRSRGRCQLYLHNATGALHGRDLSHPQGRDITHGDIQLCGGCCGTNFCNLEGCEKIPHHSVRGSG